METIYRTIKALLQYDIHGVYFDLDGTLTTVHTWKELRLCNNYEINRAPDSVFQKIAIMPRYMSNLIDNMYKAGIVVGICTDQHEDLAYRFINAVYGTETATKMNHRIIGREMRGLLEDRKSGKVGRLLYLIKNEPNGSISPCHACLIDDGVENIRSASKLFWTKLVKEGKMDPTKDILSLNPPSVDLMMTNLE